MRGGPIMAYSRGRRVRFTRLIQVPVLVLVVIACGTATTAMSASAAAPTAMLRAPESHPKYGGVLRWAGLADAPCFDLHQCGTAACATPPAPMYHTLLPYQPLDGA